jgi:hypothetical protein
MSFFYNLHISLQIQDKFIENYLQVQKLWNLDLNLNLNFSIMASNLLPLVHWKLLV